MLAFGGLIAMWPIRNHSLDALRKNPLPKCWVTLHVRYREPLPVDGNPDALVVGYIQLLGVASAQDAVANIIKGCVTEGEIDWEQTSWEEVDPGDMGKHVQRAIEPISAAGVWHKSGKIWHGA